MQITFLKAAIPLTKTFTKTPQGIEKSSYPNVYEVTSIAEKCSDLKTLAVLLEKHAALGHCMLKGNIAKPLINESRAGSTDANADTSLLLLDVDGLKIKTPADFMKLTGLNDVSYVVQYSASYRITDKLLRCHIFIWLEEPRAAPLLKQWLIALNFSVPELKNALVLTKTGNALRYGLDITTCQNDKLVYIANPECKGFRPPTHKRIEYVKGKQERLLVDANHSVMVNKALIEERIKALRTTAKLPERKNTYKLVKNTEILVRPDESIITGMKEERGFVYFNFNGGDSWGYYHPSNNPDFIFNFKGEPTYLTKELLPEYWQQVTAQQARTPVASAPTMDGLTYLAFLDRKTGSYWRGTFDEGTDTLDLYMAKNETQVRHFAAQSGFSLPEFIPEWDIVFDPHIPLRVDHSQHIVNTFQPTPYMKNKGFAKKPGKTTFPTIAKIIHHALGSERDITERFMNWLAAIFQGLDAVRTAWILHGRTGTGKGLLMNRVLSPLLGKAQVAVKRMEELNEPYNGFMERAFIVFVDEVQTSILRNEKGVMAKIKNFITEPTVSIRNMYANAYQARNRTNWIFASNMPDPVAVDMNDRRFNVGKYQTEPLIVTPLEVEGIAEELQAFYDHLMTYKADLVAASTPMETEDRRTLMSISEASIDTVANALLGGNFEFFVDMLPSTALHSNVQIEAVENYKAVLLRILNRLEPGTGNLGENAKGIMHCNVSRDELFCIFEYTVGEMPKSPNKFTSRLKHHRIHTERVRVDGILTYGITTRWKPIDPATTSRISGKPQLATVKKPK